MIFQGCESWTIKKAESQRIDAFELWYWRRLLRVPRTAGRSNQSGLKEISPEYSLEVLMLKLKLQYFGHLMWRANSFKKTLMLGKIEGRRRRGQQRVRWLDGVLCFILFVTPNVLLFTLSALFAEPRVSKAQVKSKEEDVRSHRNCRHIYSLLAATEAITVFTLYSSSCGWAEGQSHDAAVVPIALWVEFMQICRTQIHD